MTDRPRAITPFEPFDSRPKIEIAKPTRAPVDPFEGLPRLFPRDPKLPTGAGAERDTEPHELAAEDKTPSKRETPFEMILERLKEIEQQVKDSNVSAVRCYNSVLELHAKHDDERRERKRLARRVVALEMRSTWLPLLAWLGTTAVAALALYRTYR